ncbi:uncharacterized protein LOC130773752 [Actinidia eriantha]|uniref:uncharacterized protein LOC130755731 n=1 Tax=Actinidia eriantha TaxID=165200 RepID=UPI0025871D0A|nr:uncharacterized protein LOC130755731 [Actinidia eriantha]XP_057487673.1 uncharacterized protein LOC130773752 [Actinidia eriantha]
MASNRDDPLSFMIPSSSSPIDGDSFLLDPNSNSQIGSASGSFQNEGFLGGLDGAGDAAEFGFFRPEFRQGPLGGTVDCYDRHVFLCYKNPQVWPPRIEAAEFDRLPRLLSAALAARKGDMKKQTRLTICEGHDGTETSNGDVLIFPDMVRYRRLTHFDVDTFVEEVLVKDGEWLPGTPEALRGFYIFVCAHGTRDRRCGVCGPPIITRFKEEIEFHGLQGKVSVSPCSHIGGHKYAGNVIIFGLSINGEVTGHWYGYVTPDDVPVLLEQHIGKGEIVDFLWRGQMGLSEEDQTRSLELRLQVNGGSNVERITNEPTQANEISRDACGSQVEVVGCQPNGSSPCCQNPSQPENTDNHDLNEREAKLTAEKKSSKRQISLNNSSKGASTRRVCSMPTWFENWEREDTYAALAVVGAALSVAFAYRCYKQLT